MKSQSKDSKRLRGSCLRWPVPLRWSRFHARHMTNYVRLTLELETSKEIARRPRQSHWFCDLTFLPPVVHWHELWLVETISLTGQNFTVGNGLSTAVHTFVFLLMLTEMIFMSNTCIKFTPTIKAIKGISLGFLVMQSVCSCKEKTLCWQSLLFMEANFPFWWSVRLDFCRSPKSGYWFPPTAASSRA